MLNVHEGYAAPGMQGCRAFFKKKSTQHIDLIVMRQLTFIRMQVLKQQEQKGDILVQQELQSC